LGKNRRRALTRSEGVFSKKKANIQSALYDYLAWFEIGPDLIHDEQSDLSKMQWNYTREEEQALRWIIKLARVLIHLRCIAQTWDIRDDSQGSNYGYTHSQRESPGRAIEILRNLARGHALLTRRNLITLEDIPIVVKTVLSTAIIDRVGLLYLLMAHNGTLVTTEIADALKVTRTTALRNMTEYKTSYYTIRDHFVNPFFNSIWSYCYNGSYISIGISTVSSVHQCFMK
jgi:hypothetical protein